MINRTKQNSKYYLWLQVRHNWGLYLLLMPTLIYALVFLYAPMYGILIAFKDYKPSLGILKSPFTSEYGLKYFIQFVTSYSFEQVLTNTLRLSIYSLLVGTPFPIAFALLLNYVKNERFKKTVQTVTYAPHFISTVVLAGMLFLLLAPTSGIINKIIIALGGKSIFFLSDPKLFPHVYVWSGIWQNTGWDSILYIAALAGINPELHEAAVVDGANKIQRIWHIDLPGILPTVVIMLILHTGSLMSVGFEKVHLMQNNLNLATSEIMATYVYKIGLLNNQFSLSTAVGLINSLVNFFLLITINYISKRVTETSLW